MADLNKFQRSMDRINESLRHLTHLKEDSKAAQYIQSLQHARKTLEQKMDKFKRGRNISDGEASPDLFV